MSRTDRLLELLISVPAKVNFTAQELADECGVSRRTMLRDLRTLSEMGVALRSSPGPGGGYRLARGARRLALSLTVDEALALIVAYESLLRYAATPFAAQNLATVTKLRGLLAPDVVKELDQWRRHVAVLTPTHDVTAPCLDQLLRAAIDGAALEIVYDSATSGKTKRTIFPFGVYAAEGFWYCACQDLKRDRAISLRSDRVMSTERVAGRARQQAVTLNQWLHQRDQSGVRTQIRLHVSDRGLKHADLQPLLNRATQRERSGDEETIETDIRASDINYWAKRLLGMGDDIHVASPAALSEAVRAHALAITERYRY